MRAQPVLFTDDDVFAQATRHLGGVNIGWLDGHASWEHSRRLLGRYTDGELEGVSHWCPSSVRVHTDNCGWPPPDGVSIPLGEGAPPMGL